jgi:hypothetical protein
MLVELTMGRNSKTLGLVLAILFIMSLVTLQLALAETQPKTITVPDDYPTIQAAIGNATAGDTVYVRKGIYYAPYFNVIVIDKPLSLIGEDASSTIIDGIDRGEYSMGHYVMTWNGITLDAPNSTISGFTIRNMNHAIINGHSSPSGDRILGNNLSNNKVPIAWGGTDFLIEGNNITDNDEAMNIGGLNGLISNNTIEGLAVYAQNITISGNCISNIGLSIGQSNSINVYGNNITDSLQGIAFSWGIYNVTIRSNNIMNNNIGIFLDNFVYVSPNNIGKGNQIYLNNLINNAKNAFVKPDYPYNISMIDNAIGNGTDVVSWDNGTVGNYWSDYKGNGSYVIDENNVDHYPLTQQANIFSVTPTPTLTSTAPASETILIIVASIVIIVVLALTALLFRRHKKTTNLNQ